MLQGDNEYGQLCLPEEISKRVQFFPSFRKIDFFTQNKIKAKSVALGFASGHVLTEDLETGKTRIFGWGNSDHGQIGYGGTLTQYIPVEITANFPSEVIQISAGA